MSRDEIALTFNNLCLMIVLYPLSSGLLVNSRYLHSMNCSKIIEQTCNMLLGDTIIFLHCFACSNGWSDYSLPHDTAEERDVCVTTSSRLYSSTIRRLHFADSFQVNSAYIRDWWGIIVRRFRRGESGFITSCVQQENQGQSVTSKIRIFDIPGSWRWLSMKVLVNSIIQILGGL